MSHFIHQKRTESLSTGMLAVLFANLINLSLSLIRNFLLPKYLSVPAYAEIKTYQLYLSYVSLLTFGYIDGMYLRYGGKTFDRIDWDGFTRNLATFRLMMIGFSILLTVLGILENNFILAALGMTVAAYKCMDYFQSFYQAVGKFRAYSALVNLCSVAMFLVNVVLLFAMKETESRHYILGYAAVYYLVWFLLEATAKRQFGLTRTWCRFSFAEMKASITSGFTLMCGTLLSVFMMGMDRWCVKLTMDTYSFASYSFAASSVGFLSYAISPVSVTLYNYFCQISDEAQYVRSRKMIVVFTAGIIMAAFPILFILEHGLNKYLSCANVLFLLFASQMITGIILCFYVNLYKARKMQKKYFRGIVATVWIGLILNIVLFCLFHTAEAFAWGTLLTVTVWLGMCCFDFHAYRISPGEGIYITSLIVIFLICGLNFRSYWGLLVYGSSYCVLSLLFMRKQVIEIWNLIRRKVLR